MHAGMPINLQVARPPSILAKQRRFRQMRTPISGVSSKAKRIASGQPLQIDLIPCSADGEWSDKAVAARNPPLLVALEVVGIKQGTCRDTGQHRGTDESKPD